MSKILKKLLCFVTFCPTQTQNFLDKGGELKTDPPLWLYANLFDREHTSKNLSKVYFDSFAKNANWCFFGCILPNWIILYIFWFILLVVLSRSATCHHSLAKCCFVMTSPMSKQQYFWPVTCNLYIMPVTCCMLGIVLAVLQNMTLTTKGSSPQPCHLDWHPLGCVPTYACIIIHCDISWKGGSNTHFLDLGKLQGLQFSFLFLGNWGVSWRQIFLESYSKVV